MNSKKLHLVLSCEKLAKSLLLVAVLFKTQRLPNEPDDQ